MWRLKSKAHALYCFRDGGSDGMGKNSSSGAADVCSALLSLSLLSVLSLARSLSQPHHNCLFAWCPAPCLLCCSIGESEPTGVTFHPLDKASFMTLSRDRRTASCAKGYRMLKATAGVSKGAWYCEFAIAADVKPGAHFRLGRGRGCAWACCCLQSSCLSSCCCALPLSPHARSLSLSLSLCTLSLSLATAQPGPVHRAGREPCASGLQPAQLCLQRCGGREGAPVHQVPVWAPLCSRRRHRHAAGLLHASRAAGCWGGAGCRRQCWACRCSEAGQGPGGCCCWSLQRCH